MFYAHFVLSKKGPLARIWLAAHWDKKLTKAHVFETNIESSVEGILQPKVKMALRTSGHLLLGVVRIYSRKAKYLLADCNEAFIKIKMAFRPGVVDLPEENREAALNAITLPEVFHDFDSAMPDLTDIEVQAQFTLNQSRAEEITMREDYGNVTLVGDDGFGDMGFEDHEIVRDASNMDESLEPANLLFGDKKDKGESMISSTQHSSLAKHMDMDIDAPLRDDGFGGGVGEGLLSAETGGLFEPGGLFDDAPMEHVPMDSGSATNAKPSGRTPKHGEQAKHDDSDDDDDYYGDMGPPSMGCPSSGPSSPPSPMRAPDGGAANLDGDAASVHGASDAHPPPGADQTTLIQNEDETFALAPLESPVVLGTEKSKAKRKRKLIIDEVKNISGEEMKSQLADTSDIVTTLDLAPPTKRLMHWKETGGVEKLFALPGRSILSKTLSKLYQRHLTTRAKENEDIGLCTEEDRIDMETENVREDDEATRMSHKRKLSDLEQPTTTTTTQPLVLQQDSHLDLPTEPIDPQHLDLSRVLPEDPMAAAAAAAPQQMHQLPQPTEQVPLPRPPSPSVAMMMMQQQQQQIPPPQSQQLIPPTAQQQLPGMESLVDPTMPQLPLPAVDAEPFDEIAPLQDKSEQNVEVVQPPPPPLPMAEQQPVPDLQAQHQELPEDDFFSQQIAAPSTSTRVNHIDALQPYLGEDDDDMECPASVGPPEEQGADETYEQFEERVLNRRAQQMLYVIQRQFQRQSAIRFSELARNNTRKQVAQKFYTFLVLKKQQAVELHQEAAFSELLITRGPKFESLY